MGEKMLLFCAVTARSVLCGHSFSLQVVVYIDVYEKKVICTARVVLSLSLACFLLLLHLLFADDDSIIRIDLVRSLVLSFDCRASQVN